MTPEQTQLITASFSKLRDDPDGSAALFYGRLFEQQPSLRSLFQNSMKQQGRKFIDMMNLIMGSLDRLDHVVPVVWQLGKRHGGYGVQESHYTAVGAALLWTLEQKLGPDFTSATCAAWSELYSVIALTMQQAASEGAITREPHEV